MKVEARQGYERSYEQSLDCVHCGLCLPHCPTYESATLESHSPRGRILIMRALAEQRLSPTDEGVIDALDSCLACRACETACPSGVRYGSMLESARSNLNDTGRGSRFLRWSLATFLARPGMHRAMMAAMTWAQRLGLLRMATWLPIPHAIKEGIRLLPALPSGKDRRPIDPGIYEPFGDLVAEVGLFTGCMMETVFGRVNRALLYLLRVHGCRVHVPARQVCCGALQLHEGFVREFCDQTLRNVEAFPQDLDAILLDSAGCGSAMKEAHHHVEEARDFASKIRDASEFLLRLGLRQPSCSVSAIASYDDPCHLCHGQGIRSQPRRLLAAVEGLELVEMAHPESCCGSAGIYNILQPAYAQDALDRKLEEFAATGASLLITANPGCHLQWERGFRDRGQDVQVKHLIEVLAQAFGYEPGMEIAGC